MRILVLYGTSEGHTKTVAEFVTNQFEQGHEVALVDALQQPSNLDLAAFDAVVVAARVHSGLYQQQITRFVRENRNLLDALPNAFLSVSMSAAKLRPGDPERAESYIAAFVRRTGWTPRLVLHVGGARFYTRQGAIGRWILGLVDRHQFDTSRDHVWTDWEALERFAKSFPAAADPGGGEQPDLPPGPGSTRP